jgi:hypothetical protein
MPGLFHRVDEVVRAAFEASAVQVVGQDYKTKSTYKNFCKLLRSDRQEAVKLVMALMNEVYGLVKTTAEQPDLKRTAKRSESRGRYRSAHDLSAKRIKRNLAKQQDLEVTVERAIVFSQGQIGSSHYHW